MKINKKKFIVYALTFIIIFQDSLKKLIGLSILDYIDEVFILGYFLCALIYGKRRIEKYIIHISMLVLGFWLTGISGCLFFSSYDVFSLIMGSILMIKFFILIISIVLKPPTKIIQSYIVNAIKVIGKISLITGIINLLFPTVWVQLIPYTYIYIKNGMNSVMGLFIHAGQYGWFMMLVAILYYVEYKYGHYTKKRKWFLIYAIAAIFSLKVKVIVTFLVVLIFDIYILNSRKIKIKNMIFIIILSVSVYFLFGDLIIKTYIQYFTNSNNDTSARYALLNGSMKIMQDYFPLGVGFSKFASWYARILYSEYYYIYGCNTVYGLSPDNPMFGTDTFWPAIFGETGFIGTMFYIVTLLYIFKIMYRGVKHIRVKHIRHNMDLINIFGILIFVQALVESTGEPIFNSSPQNIVIAFFIGMALCNSSSCKRRIVDDKE